MARPPMEVTGAFISAINAGDLTALRALMTPDHTFTDARGASFTGADLMQKNWELFLQAFPKYWIHIDRGIADGNRIALFGEAGGKWRVDGQILPESWKTTAAWFAEIEADKVRRWTVFCDTSWGTPPEPKPIPALAIVEA
jgi:ketosteroid isomerase-like protein